MLKNLLEDWRNIDASPKRIREFAYLIGGILTAIAAYSFYKNLPNYPYFAGAGVGVVILGLVLPRSLRPFYYVWMGFALVMGLISSTIILSALFFIMFTLVGWLNRLFGGQNFDSSWKTHTDSYWQKRDNAKPKNYQNQF